MKIPKENAGNGARSGSPKFRNLKVDVPADSTGSEGNVSDDLGGQGVHFCRDHLSKM